ncbi:MAG: hypothetical protein B6D68_03145 [spirochete symbiont of Stewartia floridana]|nr:MAG: hypothetical protein B6D68_03145 [spirochete symbiont of Stewartia floridana]
MYQFLIIAYLFTSPGHLEAAAGGRRAADYIDDMDILIIDSGSTTEYLAENLPQNRSLTVMGFSLNIIGRTAKMERVESVITGGLFHQNTLMFESREGLALIQRYRATKAFISAAGVSLDLGVTCRNAYERETKMAAIESSARRILLADSSKFGVIRSEYFADIEQFDMIITDAGLDEAVYAKLEEHCIEVVLV